MRIVVQHLILYLHSPIRISYCKVMSMHPFNENRQSMTNTYVLRLRVAAVALGHSRPKHSCGADPYRSHLDGSSRTRVDTHSLQGNAYKCKPICSMTSMQFIINAPFRYDRCDTTEYTQLSPMPRRCSICDAM